jgi:hypothetical protein
MKTIEEWIEICKITHPELGKKWEECFEAENRNDTAPNIYEALNFSFIWADTKYGHTYWGDIYVCMVSNPDKYSIPKRKLFNQV